MNNNDQYIATKHLCTNEFEKVKSLIIKSVGVKCMPIETFLQDIDFLNKNICRAKYCNIDEYRLIYISEGSGVLTLESRSPFSIVKGQIIIIPPGQWYSIYSQFEAGWKEYYFEFKGEIVEIFLKEKLMLNQLCLLNIGYNEKLVTLFKRAIEVAGANKIGAQQYLIGIFMHIIGLVIFETQNKHILEISKHKNWDY